VADARVTDGGAPDTQGAARAADTARTRRPSVPRSYQTRLTIAFISVVGLTLVLVAPVVVNRLDDYFRAQEEQSLRARASATAVILDQFIENAVNGNGVVVEMNGKPELNPVVQRLLVDEGLLTIAADTVAQADVNLQFGPARPDTDGQLVPDADASLSFDARLSKDPAAGQARDPSVTPVRLPFATSNRIQDWGMVITLSNPYTSRASTLGAITGLLVIMASIAFLVAVLVAAFIAHRFTTPLTRLTEASRRLAEGDLSSRVPVDELASGTVELEALSSQFNTMAGRLQESVEIIRRDRDRGRDFLADVSHELRTPIAAMRTFIELLQGPAGTDPAARAEFLDSSQVQLDRLDWLAQNLLELSKLDSGLVLLDLRPDDIRATIESAVEQQQATAERRGIRLTASLPDRPLRIRHDPPRVGQIVTNLVGNALKFTPRGGRVRVTARAWRDGGARIEVADTGVGIDAAELPRIFDRFYRGSEANEARGTGSGLGLAIVKSIVDMHHGTIAVESRVGHGTRFVVTLPRDPREVSEVLPAQPDDVPQAGTGDGDAGTPKMDDSSPITPSGVNHHAAPLILAGDRPAAEPTHRD
jgi:signal transduction histidine kinase